MPQLTEFPSLPGVEPEAAVAHLIHLCRGLPADGEPFKAFRERLRSHDLWDRDRLSGLQRFLRLSGGEVVQPSPIISEIGAADDATARQALAERLWSANPVLFKTIIERLADRVSPPGELYSYLDSFAYRGTPVPRAQLESWVHLARGLGILKRIGIALGVGERAEPFLERAQKLDVEEFLEEDEAEVAPLPLASASLDREAAAATVAGARDAPSASPASRPPGPIGVAAPGVPSGGTSQGTSTVSSPDSVVSSGILVTM